MPDRWLIEEGIGEHRAILLGDNGIDAARVSWPGSGLIAGEVADAKLLERLGEGRVGVVEFANGEKALCPLVPRPVSIGAPVRMRVTREAMAERGRLKLAQCRFTENPVKPAPSLIEALGEEADVQIVHRFPDDADWDDLWMEAAVQQVDFYGGSLLFAETPAMTLIDIDGGPFEAITFNGIPALARSIARFDLAGNIGIDFPTVSDKGDRKVVDTGLEENLAHWPHERTAMNGFGFVQIIARLERPSLLHRIARNRAGAAARLLLRKAEGLTGAGRIELSAHPAVIDKLRPEWLDELRRRMGREVVLRPDPAIAITAPHAQMVDHA